MPGYLTHYLAGRELFGKMSENLQKTVKSNRKIFNLGSQGPDIFFYYFPGMIRKATRRIGTHMHENDLGYFLAYMAKCAKSAQNNAERDVIFSYTAGFVMHYALDANAHPYVYAKTHDDYATKLENSAEHRKFETAIDVEMLKLLHGKKPADVKQPELINASEIHAKIAATAYSKCIKRVYKRKITPGAICRAMSAMVVFTKFLQSKNGLRKRAIEFAERLTIRKFLFSSMVHPQEPNVPDCLNLNNDKWRTPWDTANVFNHSFTEIFDRAITEATAITEVLYAYVYEDLSGKELLKALGNRSLKTGKENGMSVSNA